MKSSEPTKRDRIRKIVAMCKELQLYFQLKRDGGSSTPFSAICMFPTKSFALVKGRDDKEEKHNLRVTWCRSLQTLRALQSTWRAQFCCLPSGKRPPGLCPQTPFWGCSSSSSQPLPWIFLFPAASAFRLSLPHIKSAALITTLAPQITLQLRDLKQRQTRIASHSFYGLQIGEQLTWVLRLVVPCEVSQDIGWGCSHAEAGLELSYPFPVGSLTWRPVCTCCWQEASGSRCMEVSIGLLE